MPASSALYQLPHMGLIDADPRADGAVRRVSVCEGRVMIDRTLDGIAMRLGIPCEAYRGVVLTLEGSERAPRFRLRLAHADDELSVVLHETDDDTQIVALWRGYSDLTGLPRFLERKRGVLESAEIRMGPVVIGPAPVMRRRGAIAVKRRPRFLTRRRIGERRRMTHVACERVLSEPR
jgi:hypothetical protein